MEFLEDDPSFPFGGKLPGRCEFLLVSGSVIFSDQFLLGGGPYDRYKCSEITPKKMAENKSVTDVKTTLIIGVSSLHLQLDAVLTL